MFSSLIRTFFFEIIIPRTNGTELISLFFFFVGNLGQTHINTKTPNSHYIIPIIEHYSLICFFPHLLTWLAFLLSY